ncbi:unnamed protein product [Microthlaspi erraticum]|uniref:Uncharacterized protein n=1 Tax=Microthlaspi erraticum TaxID=1685480 RepID=A0A6D2L8S5_9BRAS|nr:unnamed protein product [Microthlaspi erraticum]
MGIKAFENRLWFESKLKESLMLDEPATLQDALHRSQKDIRVEESKAHHSKIHGMMESSRQASSRQESSHQENKRRPLMSLLRCKEEGNDDTKWCKLYGRTNYTTEECRHVNNMILEYNKGYTPYSAKPK